MENRAESFKHSDSALKARLRPTFKPLIEEALKTHMNELSEVEYNSLLSMVLEETITLMLEVQSNNEPKSSLKLHKGRVKLFISTVVERKIQEYRQNATIQNESSSHDPVQTYLEQETIPLGSRLPEALNHKTTRPGSLGPSLKRKREEAQPVPSLSHKNSEDAPFSPNPEFIYLGIYPEGKCHYFRCRHCGRQFTENGSRRREHLHKCIKFKRSKDVQGLLASTQSPQPKEPKGETIVQSPLPQTTNRNMVASFSQTLRSIKPLTPNESRRIPQEHPRPLNPHRHDNDVPTPRASSFRRRLGYSQQKESSSRESEIRNNDLGSKQKRGQSISTNQSDSRRTREESPLTRWSEPGHYRRDIPEINYNLKDRVRRTFTLTQASQEINFGKTINRTPDLDCFENVPTDISSEFLDMVRQHKAAVVASLNRSEHLPCLSRPERAFSGRISSQKRYPQKALDQLQGSVLHMKETKDRTKREIFILESTIKNRKHSQHSAGSAIFMSRELGMKSSRQTLQELRDKAGDSYERYRYWTGASGDVLVGSWHPDNVSYAAGASAMTDQSSMQYNRRNNLLFGSIVDNSLTELASHHVHRPAPSTIRSGPNAQQSTYDACDPRLYTSVTGVKFSASGDRMYTSSYDQTVKVWDTTKESLPSLKETLRHESEVELMELSSDHVIATGAHQRQSSVRVYAPSKEGYTFSHLDTRKCPVRGVPQGVARVDLYPSCLRFGPTAGTRHLLLGGFAGKDSDDSEDPGQQGDACYWDVNSGKRFELTPSSQNVFDCAWEPWGRFFAIASTPRRGRGHNNIGTRSVVRTYYLERPSCAVEYECPALDMNDILFCPWNSYYISASCTDGVVYIWDYRNPDKILHRLRHGNPLSPVRSGFTREQSDTGVRFTAWSNTGGRLFTGSSDGILKLWDIRRNSEDTHIKDVANLGSEIMCGSFSPDFTNLMIGDAQGSVHILSNAPISQDQKVDINTSDTPTLSNINFVSSPDYPVSLSIQTSNVEEVNNEGRDAANELLASGQLKMHPIYGAGKGPNYHGPYAQYAREYGSKPGISPLLPHFQALQLHPTQHKLAGVIGKHLLSNGEKQNRYLQKQIAKARNVRQENSVVERRHVDSNEWASSETIKRPKLNLTTEGDDIEMSPDLIDSEDNYDIWSDASVGETEGVEDGGSAQASIDSGVPISIPDPSLALPPSDTSTPRTAPEPTPASTSTTASAPNASLLGIVQASAPPTAPALTTTATPKSTPPIHHNLVEFPPKAGYNNDSCQHGACMASCGKCLLEAFNYQADSSVQKENEAIRIDQEDKIQESLDAQLNNDITSSVKSETMVPHPLWEIPASVSTTPGLSPILPPIANPAPSLKSTSSRPKPQIIDLTGDDDDD
ncbi:MAG: hypothetical protein M1834_001851 [Cirrosporium novae-zelandiae]|nr:MAG: hypothetical protein M1834_001851 [Cirrosporium novae-zelandiae]